MLLWTSTQEQTTRSKEGVAGPRGESHRRRRWNGQASCPLKQRAKRLAAMSQAEAITLITQIRSRLAPIAERLLDIEARLAAAKADVEQPTRVSLREFTSRLLGTREPSTAKNGMVVRRTIGDQNGHPTTQVQNLQ
jgi:hypothetical protein